MTSQTLPETCRNCCTTLEKEGFTFSQNLWYVLAFEAIKAKLGPQEYIMLRHYHASRLVSVWFSFFDNLFTRTS